MSVMRAPIAWIKAHFLHSKVLLLSRLNSMEDTAAATLRRTNLHPHSNNKTATTALHQTCPLLQAPHHNNLVMEPPTATPFNTVTVPDDEKPS